MSKENAVQSIEKALDAFHVKYSVLSGNIIGMLNEFRQFANVLVDIHSKVLELKEHKDPVKEPEVPCTENCDKKE